LIKGKVKEYYNKAKNPLAVPDKTTQIATPVLVNKEVAQRIIERLVKWCPFYATFLHNRLSEFIDDSTLDLLGKCLSHSIQAIISQYSLKRVIIINKRSSIIGISNKISSCFLPFHCIT